MKMIKCSDYDFDIFVLLDKRNQRVKITDDENVMKGWIKKKGNSWIKGRAVLLD